MLDTDKQELFRVMKAVHDLLRQPMPSRDAFDMWCQKLAPYAMADIRRAFDKYLDGGKFAPVPADILGLLKTKEVNGHPDPNEAWAIALTSLDERASVCWTDAIAQALGAAQPILDIGDEVGGRMAFLEAYKRLIASQKPIWRMSYGEDPNQRITAERQAVAKGLLPRLTPQTAGLIGGPAPAEGRKLLAAARAALAAPQDGESPLERYQRQAKEWDARAKAEWEREHGQSIQGIGHEPH